MKGLTLHPQTPKRSGKMTAEDSPWKIPQVGESNMQCASKNGLVEKSVIKTP